MLHRVLAAMALALACVLAAPSFAHPNYPGLHEARAARGAKSDPSPGQPLRGRADLSRKGRGDTVALAEHYLGTNPTAMRRLWCAHFLGMIERKAGRAGTGSNMARSYAGYGRAVRTPERGDIAVLSRGKNGGHVGYFVGWAPDGRAILISGNSRGGVVATGRYSTARIIAWRRPV